MFLLQVLGFGLMFKLHESCISKHKGERQTSKQEEDSGIEDEDMVPLTKSIDLMSSQEISGIMSLFFFFPNT